MTGHRLTEDEAQEGARLLEALMLPELVIQRLEPQLRRQPWYPIVLEGEKKYIKEVMRLDANARAQKAVRTRTFRKRWTETVDAVKKRGLLLHEIKPGQRGPELAALDSLMTTLGSLVTELHFDE